MQNIINQLASDLNPQTMGLTDPTSIFGLCLVVPGLAMFIVLFFGREIFRPRWRGYWDAV